jgi:putative membrane protein
MWMHGHYPWFPLMWVFPLIFLFLIYRIFFRSGRKLMCAGHRKHHIENGAQEILDRRYAKGEISHDMTSTNR